MVEEPFTANNAPTEADIQDQPQYPEPEVQEGPINLAPALDGEALQEPASTILAGELKADGISINNSVRPCEKYQVPVEWIQPQEDMEMQNNDIPSDSAPSHNQEPPFHQGPLPQEIISVEMFPEGSFGNMALLEAQLGKIVAEARLIKHDTLSHAKQARRDPEDHRDQKLHCDRTCERSIEGSVKGLTRVAPHLGKRERNGFKGQGVCEPTIMAMQGRDAAVSPGGETRDSLLLRGETRDSSLFLGTPLASATGTPERGSANDSPSERPMRKPPSSGLQRNRPSIWLPSFLQRNRPPGAKFLNCNPCLRSVLQRNSIGRK